MRITPLLTFSLIAFSFPVSAADSPATIGRNLTATCASCHGTDGRSIGGIPAIAGLPSTYIVEQMNAFRTGVLPGTVMNQIARGYSNGQIELIARYLATQKLVP